jgi:alkylhydroperoxidase/carboxymuconolactone decarboxylase family protein YurZ
MSKDLDENFYKPLAREAQTYGAIREVGLTQEELNHIIKIILFR